MAWIQGAHEAGRVGASSLTTSLPGVVAGRLLIVGLVVSDHSASLRATNVSDNQGNVYLLAVDGDNRAAGGSTYAAIFYSLLRKGGDLAVVADLSGTLALTGGIALAEYTGSELTAPVGGTGFRYDHSSTPSVSTDDALDFGGQLVFAIYGNAGLGLSLRAGEGHYVREMDLTVQLLTETTKAMAPTVATATFAATDSPHDWVSAITTFKPAAG